MTPYALSFRFDLGGSPKKTKAKNGVAVNYEGTKFRRGAGAFVYLLGVLAFFRCDMTVGQ